MYGIEKLIIVIIIIIIISELNSSFLRRSINFNVS